MYDLKDEQWERIKDSLPGKEGDSGRSAKDNRKFIAAVMWIGRTGAPWLQNMENGQVYTKGS